MSILHNRKIMFLTGTRADFGHQKPLIDKCIEEGYDVSIFVTGMHLDDKYGHTYDEIHEFGYRNLSLYQNHLDAQRNRIDNMEYRKNTATNNQIIQIAKYNSSNLANVFQ